MPVIHTNTYHLTEGQRAFFRECLGSAYVLENTRQLQAYGQDETEDLNYPPAAALLPGTVEELQALLRYCNEQEIPVTPRGAGSGLAGGALPVCGGVVLDMKRFDRILEIDEANLQVTTEAGVITERLQNAVKEKGLYYPPAPASKGWSYIGGNISTNAGGPRAVKYGVVKDYVLNLEVVLPSGEVIWTGANTLKNSTGYNLTQLLVGSEGTLGVVTKAVLKLIPLPSHSLTLLVPFQSAAQACAAVSAIFRAGVTPSALEFMERSAIERAMDYVGEYDLPLAEDTAAHLLIEVDGRHLPQLHKDCEKIGEVLEQFEAGDILFADSEADKKKLWKLRSNVGHAVKRKSVYKEEDTVVPRAKLPELLAKVKEVGKAYGFQSICYGHAGDGNLHVNILRGELSEITWQEEVPKGIREIFQFVKQLKGTLSGEHGIGWVQRRYLDVVFGDTEIRLQRSIKQAFDPKGILNPRKILPDS